MVCLHMRLEHRDDRGAHPLRLGEVALNQGLVWIDHGQPGLRQAAEQVRGAGGLVVQERAQNHKI